jgi:hypothetical protein
MGTHPHVFLVGLGRFQLSVGQLIAAAFILHLLPYIVLLLQVGMKRQHGRQLQSGTFAQCMSERGCDSRSPDIQLHT